MPLSVSPLADAVPKLKDWPNRVQAPWGACIHTTGSGVITKARTAGADPLEYAVAYYLKPDSYGPNYVIGYNGRIVCVSPEMERAAHIGLTKADRLRYDNGAWKRSIPKAASLWMKRWRTRGFRHPLQLFIGKSPNDAYIGIEVLPVVADDPDGYTPSLKTTFTSMQHESARALLLDIGMRWEWPYDNERPTLQQWREQGRIVGHEDVTPLTRSDKDGGWDPGALRDQPRWDWRYVLR